MFLGEKLDNEPILSTASFFLYWDLNCMGTKRQGDSLPVDQGMQVVLGMASFSNLQINLAYLQGCSPGSALPKSSR